MIKKLLFTTTLLLFSFLALSQSNAEQQASEMTKEMVLALSLDDVQKEKIYKIQLQRFNRFKKPQSGTRYIARSLVPV